MICIPFRKVGEQTYGALIVLEDVGMDRLREHDPAMIDLPRMGEPWASLQLTSLTLAYETTEDCAKISALVRENKIGEVMRFITRGFKYRPELGDDDAPYLNIGGKPS